MNHNHTCLVETCDKKTACCADACDLFTLCAEHEQYVQCKSCGEYVADVDLYCARCIDPVSLGVAHPCRPEGG